MTLDLARRAFLPVLFLTCQLAFGVRIDLHCADATTDTALLNRGIANSHPGDEIRIHGDCLISGTIVLLGNRTYEGNSRSGTVIHQAGGANLMAMLASDSWSSDSTTTGDPVRIAHLTLDGNSSANSGTSALVVRSWLTVIEDLQVENAPADGIQITSVSKGGVGLQNTQVNGRISNCFVTNSGGTGIHVVDPGNSVTDWDLLDSWIASSGQSAIYMDNAAGWKVRGNHVYGIRQHAIFANRCYGTSIDENYVEDFGGSGGNQTWYGIACTVQGDAASVISGNKVFMFSKGPLSTAFIYIGVPQVNYGTGQINVVDNSIRGAGRRIDIGLSYELNGGGGLNVLSSGNDVQGVHTERLVGSGVKLVAGF